MYARDEDWQGKVEEAIRNARLVVIRTGMSQGLFWELDQVVRLLTPDRLLIVVDDKAEMHAFLDQIRTVHTHVRKDVPLRGKPIGSVRGLLAFDRRWQVLALKMRRSTFSKRQAQSMVGPRFQRTLKPVFQQLNVPWKRPEIHWVKVALAFCMGVGILTLLVTAVQ
jgi:hypothetical protein